MAEPVADDLELQVGGPADAPAVLILAHGAGQPMDSPFMAAIAGDLAAAGIRVVRFNFPYMTRAKREGKRRPPDREPVLLETFRTVIAMQRTGATLFIGGKSLGGRMASLLADEPGIAGLVCLGYPFHPPGRPERLRTAQLERLGTPALICQGTRDPFGNEKEVSKYSLSESIEIYWIEDGEHSFRPRKASGRTEAQNLADAAAAVTAFIRRVAG
jgi:predicted alpha/beta-hydrolase family hydrolase